MSVVEPISNSKYSPRRHVAYGLRALGKAELPQRFCVAGNIYRHEMTVKHDFWAATGFYRDDSGKRVVLKMGRMADFAGFPLQWVGRWLTRREVRFFKELADLPRMPRVIGMVGKTGFVRDYIAGRSLERGKEVPDGFFDDLEKLMEEVHARKIAYVDTNKPQNILIGEDARPYLIDFQISYDLKVLGNNFVGRWLLKRLQREDVYHLLKHKRRMRPDEMSCQERNESQTVSWMIRTHRWLTRPYFRIRRHTFRRLRESGRLLPAGSE